MKLQGLGIIFAIIILPIAVILSYYIQMQVDTINLRTSYDTKVLDATHDAVAALELNTANEKLSDVSDSLRSILEASNNVFFNTLLTNFGLSNASPSLFQPYVPSILYTLYDGYYIYSPTRSPDVLKFGDYETMTLSGVIVSAGSIIYGDGSSPSVIPRPDFDTSNTDPQNIALVNINGQAVIDIKGQMYYKYKGNAAPGSDYIVTNTGDYFVADITQADLKNDYLLKSYMPYAARYKWSGGDIVINYTLDNYMNIEGTVGDVYYTKTGYLIDPDSVVIDTSTPIKEIVFESEEPDGTRHYSYQDANIELLKYNEQDLEELVASGRYSNINIRIRVPDRDDEGSIKTDANGVVYITNQVALKLEYAPEESLASIEESLRFDETRYQEANAIWRNSGFNSTALYDPTGEYNSANAKPAKEWMDIYINQIKEKKSRIQVIKAVQYYLRNKVFSEWVYTNLKDIEEKDTEQILSRDTITQRQSDEEKAGIDLFRDFSDSHVKIFGDDNRNQDVELNSPFINHKLSIMRNSIQYNLNLAFSVYTKKTKTYIYELPIMSDSEWDKILSRVSMVAYFEGMPCGSKTYSNYSVVSSTNNEITVIPDELYYVPTISFSDGNTEAHRIDCDKLVNETFIDGEDLATTYDANRSYLIAFRSKELKYDRVYNKNTDQAEYDYMNLMCYDCIVNNNMRFDHIKRPTNSEKHYGLDSAIDFKYLSERLDSGSNKEKILYREYLIAVASQRQGLYKTNAMTRSEGYKTDITNTPINYGLVNDTFSRNIDLASGKSVQDIKGLEITIANLKSSDVNEVTVQFTVLINGIEVGQDVLNASKYTKNQTLRISVDPNLLSAGGSQLTLKRNLRNSAVTGKIVGIRVIYK